MLKYFKKWQETKTRAASPMTKLSSEMSSLAPPTLDRGRSRSSNDIFRDEKQKSPSPKRSAPTSPKDIFVKRCQSEVVRNKTDTRRASRSKSTTLFKIDETLSLSPLQIKTVQKMWSLAKQRDRGMCKNRGGDLSRKLVNKSPAVADVFELGRTMDLHNHCDVMIEHLDKIMESLGENEKTMVHLQEIGKNHAHLRSQGFNTSMLDAFVDVMIEEGCRWGEAKGQSKACHLAWTVTIIHIAEGIKEGFRNELRNRRRSDYVELEKARREMDLLKIKTPKKKQHECSSEN